MELFISHASEDRSLVLRLYSALQASGFGALFLDFHPDSGIPVGARWEALLWRALRRCRAVIAVCTNRWLTSPWCLAEAMLARERGKPVFVLRVKETPQGAVPTFLLDRQALDLDPSDFDSGMQLLVHGLRIEGLDMGFTLPHRPYPGLFAYQEKDAGVFFGRAEESARLRDWLGRRQRGNALGFLVVLGASGSGKSSLLRAGFLAHLRSTEPSATAPLLLPTIAAGRGLLGLATTFSEGFRLVGVARSIEDCANRAQTDLEGLASELLNRSPTSAEHVLLSVDQLEEALTDGASDPLVPLLARVAGDRSGPVLVVATLRSDFLHVLQGTEGVAGRYVDQTLDPMPRSRFGEVIAGPAAAFGLDLEPGLSERIIEDAAYDDALPLLSFTLDRLYEEEGQSGQLTIRGYTSMGGVVGAIRHATERILAQTGYASLLNDDERILDLRRAMYSMARMSDLGRVTRRIAFWSRMPQSCSAILASFVRERLLVRDQQEGKQVVTVAHEALFRVWGRLREWLELARRALALRQQIEVAAYEWLLAGRASSHAWPDERLMPTVIEIEGAGVSLDDSADPTTVRRFLGPTDAADLLHLITLRDPPEGGPTEFGPQWKVPLSHHARASAGVRLAHRGDRRAGVGLDAFGLPDIAWCDVRGGTTTVEYRAEADNPHSRVLRRTTATVSPFRMARYPVTIVQFGSFIKDVLRNGQIDMSDVDDLLGNQRYVPPRHRTTLPNHPADGISWVDAALFCRWLAQQTGYQVRLPTEHEWQVALTAGEAYRDYPWGETWDRTREPWRANTHESDLGFATAVGLYPEGATSSGIHDMIGTLWEWTADLFDPRRPLLGRRPTKRALRGESWSYNPGNIPKQVRYGASPHYRSLTFGFRIVQDE